MNRTTATSILLTKLSFILLALSIFSCNPLKTIADDEYLLLENQLYINGKKSKTDSILSIVSPKPNTRIFTFPLKLFLYQMAAEDSKGQKKSWLAKVGEPIVLVDEKAIEQSKLKLKSFFEAQGYFKTIVEDRIIKHKRKNKAKVRYNITLGHPFKIDSISTEFASELIDSIYKSDPSESFIKKGETFKLNKFKEEQNRITQWFKNNGVYNFQPTAIRYAITRDTLAEFDPSLEVLMKIENPKGIGVDGTPIKAFKKHMINQVNVYIDVLPELDQEMDTIDYYNYRIYFKDQLAYKPKVITDAIYFEKDQLYTELDRQRTYRQISNLNTFKYPSISFEESEATRDLNTSIFLNSKDKYTSELSLDVTHSNIQKLGLAFSSSLIARNVFKGAELLSISARGSVGLLGDAAISPKDYVSEFGLDFNINIPSLWFPILNSKPWIPSYMLPKTRVSLGRSIQSNIGLDKQTFNTTYGFNWSKDDAVKHSLSLIDVQYIQNLNPSRFYAVYQNTYDRLNNTALNYSSNSAYNSYFEEVSTGLQLSVPEGTAGFIDHFLTNEDPLTENYKEINSISERQKRLTENNLIAATHYTFTKNNSRGITDPNFYQLKLKLESAGNLLAMLSRNLNVNKDDSGTYVIAGVPFSQYVKTEIDFIKHWRTGDDRMIAFRSFAGIAIPYGNSSSVPFTRSYFAGGSNDIRAWNAYELGPGSSNNQNDFNEANFKLAFNLEYRFPLAGNIKAALFTDAGNIWNVYDNIDDPKSTFNGFNSLKDIALGSGFGIRYDFDYFVFRVDLGFKTYDPSLSLGNRWFRSFNFANSVINIGINYPF